MRDELGREKCGGEVPPPSGFEKGANLAGGLCALVCGGRVGGEGRQQHEPEQGRA